MTLSIAQGGTGAVTSADARTKLGLDTLLAAKANAADVASSLLAKANVLDMNTGLAAKLDANALPTALATKADLVGGKIPSSQIPPIAITDVFTVTSQAAMLALIAERGDIAIRADINTVYILSTESPGTLADWLQISVPSGAVTSVVGKTGIITAADIQAAINYAKKADLDANNLIPLVQMANLNLGSIGLDDYYSMTQGGTDWSPALAAAFADMDSGQKYLRIPNGDRNMLSKVTRSSSNKVVIEGRGRSALNWQNADGGIDLTYASVFQAPTIEGLFLRTAVAAGGCPLRITAPYSASVTVLGLLLDEIRCIGTNPASTYWSTGVVLNEAWNPRIRGYNFKGFDQTANPFNASAGLILNNCQAVMIRDPFIAHAEIGVSETGDHWSEGFQLSGGEMVGVSTGIALQSSVARLGTSIHDTHINAYLYCVDVLNQWGISVHDNLFFKTNFASGGWSAVRSRNGRHGKFHDNHLRPAGASGSANGFIIRDGTFNKVHDNTGDDWGSQGGNMVTLFGVSSYNEIFTNSRMGNSPPPINYQDAGTGTGNRYFGNAPENPLPAVQ